MGCAIIGCGKAAPAKKVTNDDLAEFMETSDEWVTKRTGIRKRSISVGESTTDLAVAAARQALGLEPGGWTYWDDPVDPETIDLVICMTMTPDQLIPSEAALVRRSLGLSQSIAFDLNAACAGCVYGLTGAEALMASAAVQNTVRLKRNRIRRALLIGVDRMSRVMNWQDRSTSVLFGDGAGAMLTEWFDDEPGILSSFLENTDDDLGDLITGNIFDMSTFPFGADDLAEQREDEAGTEPFMQMNGQHVFKFATRVMADALTEALRRADLEVDELSCIVPHQANVRIIAYAAKKLGVPLERFILNIDRYGNTSSASMPIALCDAYASGRIQPGDKVALVGFGGGFTAGAIVFQSL